MIIAGASAYPRTIDFVRFMEIAKGIGAYLMADIAHIAGLVATGLHPTPIGKADFVTTTTHKTLRGPRGGLIFSQDKYSQRLDKGLFPGVQGGPLMHIIAAKAVAFGEALKPQFADYQKQVVSNEATVGIYNYTHGRHFVEASESMIRKNLRVNGEFYVAPAYNELIGGGMDIGYYNVGEEYNGMYGMGIPGELKQFEALDVSEKAATF